MAGLDPGTTSGLALFCVCDGQVEFLGSWEIVGTDVVMRWLWIMRDSLLHVAYERFVITERTVRVKRVESAPDIIGALKFAELSPVPGLTISAVSAATHMLLVPDALLKQLDMYHASSGGHANDACRIALHHLASAGLYDKRRLILNESD